MDGPDRSHPQAGKVDGFYGNPLKKFTEFLSTSDSLLESSLIQDGRHSWSTKSTQKYQQLSRITDTEVTFGVVVAESHVIFIPEPQRPVQTWIQVQLIFNI